MSTHVYIRLVHTCINLFKTYTFIKGGHACHLFISSDWSMEECQNKVHVCQPYCHIIKYFKIGYKFYSLNVIFS